MSNTINEIPDEWFRDEITQLEMFHKIILEEVIKKTSPQYWNVLDMYILTMLKLDHGLGHNVLEKLLNVYHLESKS